MKFSTALALNVSTSVKNKEAKSSNSHTVPVAAHGIGGQFPANCDGFAGPELLSSPHHAEASALGGAQTP